MSDAKHFEPMYFTPLRYRNSADDIENGDPEFPAGCPEYLIRPLDGMEAQDVTGRIEIVGEQLVYTGDALRSAIKYGLLGWRNVTRDGDELEYSKQNIRLLPALDITACGGEIINRTEFAGDDVKN